MAKSRVSFPRLSEKEQDKQKAIAQRKLIKQMEALTAEKEKALIESIKTESEEVDKSDQV